MAWYLESTKAKGLRFKIVALNKETKVATLLGPASKTPFDRSITQADLDKFGYRIVKVEDDAAAGLPEAQH